MSITCCSLPYWVLFFPIIFSFYCSVGLSGTVSGFVVIIRCKVRGLLVCMDFITVVLYLPVFGVSVGRIPRLALGGVFGYPPEAVVCWELFPRIFGRVFTRYRSGVLSRLLLVVLILPSMGPT